MKEMNVKRRRPQQRPVPNPREEAKKTAGVRRRKRRKRRYTVYYVLLMLIVVTAMVTLSLTVFFNVKTISVENNSIYQQSEIIQASGVEEGNNLLRMDTGQVEQKILDQFVYLDEVSVRRSLPSTLIITCTAAEQTYNYQMKDGTYAYISRNGRVLEISQAAPSDGAVTVLGLDLENVQQGDFIQEGHSEQLKRLSQVQEKIQNAGLSDITQIDLSDEDTIGIQYQGRIRIEADDLSDMDYLLKAAVKLLSDSIGENESGTIFYIKDTQSIHFLPDDGSGTG